MINDFDPADEGLRVLADGLDALLLHIEELLREEVLGKNLPIVGEQLDEAADFVHDVRVNALPILRDQLSPNQLVDEVKMILHEALGSVMQLSDRNSDGVVDYRDIDLLLDTTSQEAALNLSLGDRYVVDAGIDFELGLPGIGFDLDGGVEASLEWAIDFGVGVNKVDGFYVDTSNSNEIELDLEVTLPDAALTGTLGIFEVEVADQGSKFSGEFNVDLKEPSGDGKLTFSELIGSEAGAPDLVAANFSGDADVLFAISAGTTFEGLPELDADFVLDWEFDGSDLSGSVQRLAIENITLDLGSFVSGFAGDVLGKVQSVLQPIQPIVDILTTPLPVANDIDFLVGEFAAETSPYDAVNLLDLAALQGHVDVKMLDAIVQIIDVANSIPVPPSGEGVRIPLGEVVIVDGASDPSSVTSENASVEDKSFADELENYSGSESQEEFARDSAAFLNKMSSIEGGGFQFPVLDNPASLIGVLLGQDATLFAYQTPQLSADFSMGITVPITGPFAIEFVGGIGVDAQFSFGYDTRGLRQFIDSKDVLDLANGFFVSDRENVDGTGSDVAEVTLRGSLEAFAALTAGVASVSVGGGVYATIGANLHDNDGDGKVRVEELIENLPLCVFDLSGSLSAGLRLKAQVLGLPFSQDIARVKLLEFAHSCSPATNLQLGQLDDDGVYTLFVGDRATSREVGEGITDEFVTFATTLDDDGKEALEVSAFGITETVSGVKKIVANAGDGNDSLVVIGSLNIPVEFHGGTGDDDLVGGEADDVLQGGSGDDFIDGGSGDDAIRGGAGDNQLHGGSGDDSITGGDRDDYIDGGSGIDSISGGRGRDVILGGAGDDSISGGEGDDEIYGQTGLDIISAGDGDDLVQGGNGDDSIDGGLGDDYLEGGSGDDFIHGGQGMDQIYGQKGTDIAYGGFGEDWIYGGDDRDLLFGGNEVVDQGYDVSKDRIFGNVGNDILVGDDGAIIDFDGTDYYIDILYGGTGNDVIEGGLGDDWIHGVGGEDHLSGENGNDHLLGGAGDDQLFGHEGSDWLEGNAGSDEIEGHAGGDLIAGGLGVDILDGGADEDQIYSHEVGGAEPWHVSHFETEDDGASDIVFGRSGPDEIVGGIGDDQIDAGTGDDAILPGEGDDFVNGGLGDDYIDVSLGEDEVVGQWGTDEFVLGEGVFKRIDGTHGRSKFDGDQFTTSRDNRLSVFSRGVQLDLLDELNQLKLTDIGRIDASFAKDFSIALNREAIDRITNSDSILRLDINETSNATLEGTWVEHASEMIDGVEYRRLTSEGVTLLVTDLKPQQGTPIATDVNVDGTTSPIDALLIINHLNESASSSPVLTPGNSLLRMDVSGDNSVSPLDALIVISELNSSNASGEGEPESTEWVDDLDAQAWNAIETMSESQERRKRKLYRVSPSISEA